MTLSVNPGSGRSAFPAAWRVAGALRATNAFHPTRKDTGRTGCAMKPQIDGLEARPPDPNQRDRREERMSDLFVVAFNDELQAEAVRLDLRGLKRDHLMDLEEAVVVVRTSSGKVVMHHSTHFTLPVAIGGGVVGTLVGLMLLNPLLALIGGIAGTALGAVTGALKEVGIEEPFMRELASHLKPGSSALFVLAREGRAGLIREEVEKFGGTILQVRLEHEDHDRLQAVVNSVRAER